MKFASLWKKIARFSLAGERKSHLIFELCSEALKEHPNADIAECGVYKGGTAVMLATLLKKHRPHRRVWLFDSFIGLPKIDPDRDCYYAEGGMSGKEEKIDLFRNIKKLLKKNKCDSHTILSKGWFDKTLPRIPKNQKFSFIHVDCDIYSSTKVCIEQLYPKLVEGGVMLFDDYLDIGRGQRLAVNEFLKKSGEQLFAGWYQQAYIIKGRKPMKRDKPFLIQPKLKGQVPIQAENLLKDKAWLKFMRNDPSDIQSFIPNPNSIHFILSLQHSAFELYTIFESLFSTARKSRSGH